eukprot:4526574-Prymnesium_polylepis.2
MPCRAQYESSPSGSVIHRNHHSAESTASKIATVRVPAAEIPAPALEARRAVVGHADRARLALAKQRRVRTPLCGVELAREGVTAGDVTKGRVRPVQHEQVKVLDAEQPKRGARLSEGCAVALFRVSDVALGRCDRVDARAGHG